jgi:hypothetical protein
MAIPPHSNQPATDPKTGTSIVYKGVDLPGAPAPVEPKPVAKKKSRKGFWLFCLIMLGGLAATGFFLPEIVQQSQMAPGVVNSYLTPLGIKADFDVEQLSWNKPIILKNVSVERLFPFSPPPANTTALPETSGGPAISIADPAASPSGTTNGILLKVDQVSTSASLWELIRQTTSRYELSLLKPVGQLVNTPSGTNWDAVINSSSKGSSGSSGSPPPIVLDIEDGTIELEDQSTQQQVRLEHVQLKLAYEPQLNNAGKVESSFDVIQQNQKQPCMLKGEWNDDGGGVVLHTERLPLAVIAPYIASVTQGRHFQGEISGDVDAAWTMKPAFAFKSSRVNLTSNEIQAQGPDLPPDLKFQNLKIQGAYGESAADQGNANIEFNLVTKEITRPFKSVAQWNNAGGQAQVSTEKFPLSLISSTVADSVPGFRMNGESTGNVQVAWQQTPQWNLNSLQLNTTVEQMAVTMDSIAPRVMVFPQAKISLSPLNFTPTGTNANAPVNVAPIHLSAQTWNVNGQFQNPQLIEPVLDLNGKPTKQYRAVWQDDHLNLQSQVKFTNTTALHDPAENLSSAQQELLNVQFMQGACESQTATISFEGGIQDLYGIGRCDFRCQGPIDSNRLQGIFAPSTLVYLQFNGTRIRQLQLQGDLAPAAVPAGTPSTATGWKMDGQFDWQQGRLNRLPIEAGVITAAYRGDTLQLIPQQVKLMNGTLKPPFTFVFTNDDTILKIPKGVVLERAKLTKEFAQDYLEFVSPLFSEATSVEGEFSLAVEEMALSFNNYAQQRLQGELTFYSTRVGPGAMFGQIVQLVESVRAISGKEGGGGILNALNPQANWVELPPQNIKLLLDKGRLFHDQLKYQIGDATLLSQGSVGVVDQTISEQILMPIPDKWTDGKKILSMIGGQEIKFQITGTVSQPRLDKGALADMGKLIGAGAAGNLINNILDRRKNK